MKVGDKVLIKSVAQLVDEGWEVTGIETYDTRLHTNNNMYLARQGCFDIDTTYCDAKGKVLEIDANRVKVSCRLGETWLDKSCLILVPQTLYEYLISLSVEEFAEYFIYEDKSKYNLEPIFFSCMTGISYYDYSEALEETIEVLNQLKE